MFDFFDSSTNPFMAMMNPDQVEEDGKNFAFPFSGTEAGNPMVWMQQAWMMQMQFAMSMFMMPLQMMQGLTGFLGAFRDAGDEGDDREPAQTEGFQIGSMTIPPEMLQGLMKLEMSPENLKKLQKFLDFTFSLLPDPKDRE